MSDADNVIANSKQLASTSTWNKTPRQLRQGYNPDSKDMWGGAAIHASATELTQKLPSRSEFRPDDKPVDTLAGMLLNAEGRINEFWVIYLANEFNYAPAITLLEQRAKAGSDLAKTVLEKIKK